MMKNKKGLVEVPVTMFIIWSVSFLALGNGFGETYRNGVLKNNGKKIWCKMQNKGADYCDAKY